MEARGQNGVCDENGAKQLSPSFAVLDQRKRRSSAKSLQHVIQYVIPST